ncbi:glutathione transferase [Sarracenia purpurea var. burkii]
MGIFDGGRKLWSSKGDDQEATKKEFISSLKLLEGQLGDAPYFGSNDFGFVDVALILFYSGFYVYETCGRFSIEAECPKLVLWVKRCIKRQSVIESIPDPAKVYDFVLIQKKKLGIE